MASVKDITGQKFGMLTVVKRGENSKGKAGMARWWCQCDCGNPELYLATGARLRNGTTTCCSVCVAKKISKIQKKHNEYDLSGEYGIGFTRNQDLYGRNEFYFDLEDYDKIKDYCWNFDGNGYLQARDCENKTMTQMHRVIMSAGNGIEADHIHGNKSRNDNRKSNLRLSNHSQNLKNLSLSRNNKSGVTGVFWHKKREKWIAYITVDGKRKHLGYFDNMEDAKQARFQAEKKYFKEFSPVLSQTIGL